MLCIGRPDGRLCCLAKSESAVILAGKQAAFIRNPDFSGDGSGPDIVTIGHNPNEPNLGYCHYLTLQAKDKNNQVVERKKFLDEYIFERLYLATKPFTASLLRALVSMKPEIRPYGCHHIDPLYAAKDRSNPLIKQLFNQSIEQLRALKKQGEEGDSQSVAIKVDEPEDKELFSKDYKVNANPSIRLAFLSRLDSPTLTIEELQVIVQQFYECRVASLERYIGYCVMFHAMAASNCKPWLSVPWDIARSQSNLRVATTASPVAASHDNEEEVSKDTFENAKQFAFKLRGYKSNY